MPQAPTAANTDIQAGSAAARARALAMGNLQTILTGPSGLTKPATSGPKALLGG
ncbi:MAG: hypothetical protein KGI71_04685 [Patescibacteria group bacterium]|nr:hypothetical protein [Patescibacteria group bacterium]